MGAKWKFFGALKLVTVFEKTFDDTIVDVIFDTARVTLEKPGQALTVHNLWRGRW